MKKYSFITISLAVIILIAYIPLALAQETPPEEDAAPAAPSENIAEPQSVTPDLQYDIILEYFLNKTLQKDYKTAYALTHADFRKLNPVATFETILKTTGLDSFASKKWIEFTPATNGALVKGEFTMPDQTVHLVTFALQPDAAIGSKINGIIETITVANLEKRVPDSTVVAETAKNDLARIIVFIKRGQTKKLYNYLSTGARQRTTFKDIQKAVRLFKKNKLDVTFPKTAEITITEDSPKLNEQGILFVQGSYKNAKNTVNFLVGYDYEWTWKLGFFSLTPQAAK